MIKQTKIGLEIDVKAYLKEVKGFYYVILVYKNAAGKRKDKSFPTKLPVSSSFSFSLYLQLTRFFICLLILLNVLYF